MSEQEYLLLLVSGDNPYRVDAQQIGLRASLLQKYLCDEQKELQALYALQALMVHMEQPASECRATNLPVGCNNASGGQKNKYDTVALAQAQNFQVIDSICKHGHY